MFCLLCVRDHMFDFIKTMVALFGLFLQILLDMTDRVIGSPQSCIHAFNKSGRHLEF